MSLQKYRLVIFKYSNINKEIFFQEYVDMELKNFF